MTSGCVLLYQMLLRRADTVLKDDVLASKELLVMPDGSVTLNMPMDEDAQFVAVVGLFNRPDQKDNRWRLVLTRDDLNPDMQGCRLHFLMPVSECSPMNSPWRSVFPV